VLQSQRFGQAATSWTQADVHIPPSALQQLVFAEQTFVTQLLGGGSHVWVRGTPVTHSECAHEGGGPAAFPHPATSIANNSHARHEPDFRFLVIWTPFSFPTTNPA